MNYNKVILIGRLVREPEPVMLPSGSQMANLVVAYNRNYKTPEGNWKEESHFFEIKVFGKLAERILPQLGKGDLVLIEGRLHQDKWNDKNTGEPRSKVRIVALDIKLLGKAGPRTAQEPLQEPMPEFPPVGETTPESEGVDDLEKFLFGEEERQNPQKGEKPKKEDDLDLDNLL